MGQYFLIITIHISVTEDCFSIRTGVESDGMPHHVAFHLGLHLFSKYPLKVSSIHRVKT